MYTIMIHHIVLRGQNINSECVEKHQNKIERNYPYQQTSLVWNMFENCKISQSNILKNKIYIYKYTDHFK